MPDSVSEGCSVVELSLSSKLKVKPDLHENYLELY